MMRFSLSNPTSRVEATPQDIIAWTEGNALVATGSPFNPVVWKDKIYPIAQCNNAFIFPHRPGLLLPARHVSPMMLMSASETLVPVFAAGPERRRSGTTETERYSESSPRATAFVVGKMAQQQGVA